MRSANLIRELEKAGWTLKRIRGSHHVFVHPSRRGIVVVPHPKRELKRRPRRRNSQTGRPLTHALSDRHRTPDGTVRLRRRHPCSAGLLFRRRDAGGSDRRRRGGGTRLDRRGARRRQDSSASLVAGGGPRQPRLRGMDPVGRHDRPRGARRHGGAGQHHLAAPGVAPKMRAPPARRDRATSPNSRSAADRPHQNRADQGDPARPPRSPASKVVARTATGGVSPLGRSTALGRLMARYT